MFFFFFLKIKRIKKVMMFNKKKKRKILSLYMKKNIYIYAEFIISRYKNYKILKNLEILLNFNELK